METEINNIIVKPLAKISNYDAKQLSEYEQSYNDYLGFKASMDYQFNQGMEKGEEIGMKRKARYMAVKLIKKGMSNEEISDITDLTISEIEEMRNESKNND